MKSAATTTIPPLQFPYHVGPVMRELTTSFIYHGALAATPPGWFSPVLQNVRGVLDAAKGTVVEAPLRTAINLIGLAAKVSNDVLDDIKELGERVRVVQVVYPGTPEAYRSWEDLEDTTKACLATELQGIAGAQVAATELCWRINELVLIGLTSAEVVDVLEQRITASGGWLLLFAECLMNRVTIATAPVALVSLSLVTTSLPFVELLGGLGASFLGNAPASEIREEQLSFVLFDALLAPHVKTLTSKPRARALADLLDTKQDEIGRFRAATKRKARELRAHAGASEDVRGLLREVIETTNREVAAIADLDEATTKRVGARLTESPTLWASVAGLVGTALSTLPAIVPAALAVSACSALGTAALASRRERSAQLRSSSWSLVYYCKRLLDAD